MKRAVATQLVSVVIPTFNRSGYLPRAVESVLGQQGAEVEVIIVDDGSTDDTAAVVERLAAGWGARVRYLRQDNAERSVARNNGLRRARGEFVAFLDSDDLWRPNHAQACLAVLNQRPEAAAAYGEYGLVAADERVVRDWVSRPASTGSDFLRNLCLKRLILHPTEVVLRRSALNGSDVFDPEIPGAEDWLLWVSLATRVPFCRVGIPTVWMRIHPGGTFGNPAKFVRSLMLAAEKVIATGTPAELGIPGKRVIAINRVHSAYAHYLSDQRSDARRLLAAALWQYPPVLREPDFWRVASRLCVGKRLARRIRAIRQRGRVPSS
jgi:glycosyltransferase involved in cell wall biosynthesis